MFSGFAVANFDGNTTFVNVLNDMALPWWFDDLDAMRRI